MTVQRTRDYEDPQQRQRRDSDDDTDNEKNDDGPKTAKTTGSDDGDDDTEKDSDDAGESTCTGDGIDETEPAPPKQGRAPCVRYSFVGPYKRKGMGSGESYFRRLAFRRVLRINPVGAGEHFRSLVFGDVFCVCLTLGDMLLYLVYRSHRLHLKIIPTCIFSKHIRLYARHQ